MTQNSNILYSSPIIFATSVRQLEFKYEQTISANEQLWNSSEMRTPRSSTLFHSSAYEQPEPSRLSLLFHQSGINSQRSFCQAFAHPPNQRGIPRPHDKWLIRQFLVHFSSAPLFHLVVSLQLTNGRGKFHPEPTCRCMLRLRELRQNHQKAYVDVPAVSNTVHRDDAISLPSTPCL